MGVAIKHITDPVPQILLANPNLPPAVEEIIQIAMAKSKDDRFSTAVEMVEALRAAGSGGGNAQLRTRTMKAAAPKTVMAGTKVSGKAKKKGFNVWAVIVPVLLLAMIGWGYFIFGRNNSPAVTEAPETTATSAPATATSEPVIAATDDTSAVVPLTEVPTDTPVPVTDTPSAPAVPELGGADMIALVANNEIWLMNVDGTDPKQVTFDGASKSDLQWIDHDRLIFISGKTVKYYTVSTDTVETLTNFNSEASLDGFRVSHDGKQVMISMSNEIFVVPFDIDFLKTVTTRNPLIRNEASCILPTPKTEAALRVQETRWSADDKLVAWLYKGNDPLNKSLQAEQVLVLDISACKPELISKESGAFPGLYFTPEGYVANELPDFDWDGKTLFSFNTARRNDGWGEFYLFNYITNKPTWLHPVNNSCCYRDIRFSPDGSYVLFAFQDQGLGSSAPSLLYYIEAGLLEAGGKPTLIQLPEGFFKNAKESPQPAWRPVE